MTIGPALSSIATRFPSVIVERNVQRLMHVANPVPQTFQKAEPITHVETEGPCGRATVEMDQEETRRRTN